MNQCSVMESGIKIGTRFKKSCHGKYILKFLDISWSLVNLADKREKHLHKNNEILDS